MAKQEPSNPRISTGVRAKLEDLLNSVQRYHEKDRDSANTLYQMAVNLLREVGML